MTEQCMKQCYIRIFQAVTRFLNTINQMNHFGNNMFYATQTQGHYWFHFVTDVFCAGGCCVRAHQDQLRNKQLIGRWAHMSCCQDKNKKYASSQSGRALFYSRQKASPREYTAFVCRSNSVKPYFQYGSETLALLTSIIS